MASTDREEHPERMNPKFRERLLDRLAELAQDNEQRTLEYLGMAETRSSGAERQRRYEEKRAEAGMRPMKAWVSETDIPRLKQAFPGPRAGIDWQAVIAAALKLAEHQPDDSQ